VAMGYARALRATDQRAQAVAVLEQATIRNPHNMPLLGAYGRAQAEAGDYNQALDVLSRAHTPDNPDWRILNAQGAVLDQLGRHAEASRDAARCGTEGAAESCAGGRPARQLRGSREDRPRRSAARRGRRQCHLSATDACAAQRLVEKGRAALPALARRRDLTANFKSLQS